MSDNLFFDKKYEILIVDDIPANLELLSNILYARGLEISFAHSGKQALDSVEYQSPDLILLDISMPEMDGYEVCRRLKAAPKTKDIPVIFLTALSDTENLVQGFRVGGQDYVTKPFNAEELLMRVQTHLELKEKRKEIEIYAKKLEEQKQTIEQKNKDLTASINYAKLIQGSLLASIDDFRQYFDEVFVLYRPKDIVSGDFYYFKTFEDHIIFAAADCTGHGVPGALVSMLGTTLLNQIIIHEKIHDPAKILAKLDIEFKSLLTSSNTIARMGDGMDIAICNYTPKTGQITFSGSKRPLYLLRNGELSTFKGSLHSIGGFYQVDKTFENKEIQLLDQDKFYIGSDGYVDQFGGKKEKKFTTKKFKNLLLKIADRPLSEQQEILEDHLARWQGDLEQVDDILLIGCKYKSPQ